MAKPRKCRCGCGDPIPDGNTLRKWATVDCAMRLIDANKAKVERREWLTQARQTKLDKARIKARSQWLKEAQAAFNAYVRERDRDLPCISCGDFTLMTRGGDYDCGHYRSVGANPELRFEPLNSHKQCKRCNGHLSGNVVNYRIGLLMRVGAEQVAWLEGPHEPKKYTIDDLAAIKAEYRAKLRDLKRSPVYAV